MAYKCPKCDQTSEEAGNCSVCNVPMEETTPSQEGAAPETSQPQESPEVGEEQSN